MPVRWPIRGGGEVPINNLICLAANYTDHAKEMGTAPPSAPVWFLKPNSALLHDGDPIVIPPGATNVQHEVEMAVVIGKRGKGIAEGVAFDRILGYALLLDITARDLQKEAREMGRPWTRSKGFDTFAPLSAVVPKADIPHPEGLSLRLWVNGTLRQDGNTANMVFGVPQAVAAISRDMTLLEGDIIATGTPAGVGELKAGDTLEAVLQGVGRLRHAVRSG